MGSILSKEQLMIKAIEHQDINAMKILINDLTREQMNMMCKYIVPRNEYQYTILHLATWQNNPQLLNLLLDYADDLEIRDGFGWTPLMTAINRDSKENIKILLNRGAKINCDFVQGMDLIAIAMAFHDTELIEILMDHGAQVIFTPDMYVNHEYSMGCYLLHFAVDDGLIDIAKLLIEKGKIPINTLDQTGWSPLHLAAGHNYLDIVKLLLQYKADINIKDYYGNTPLAWAKQMYATEVINELEKHGGIADTEWYGEKLMLHGYKEQIEDDQKLYEIENNQFEIDESKPDKTLKDKSPLLLDALQRQR
ncbi:unnamed protein product [Rotaria sordida]|uniref:Uncharacterized protein n=2 Tax=Rotaria sordida TaxID=392033 RepID=A0A814QDS6_9BILA|nr:unnamed protein product [Rotaria sordida]